MRKRGWRGVYKAMLQMLVRIEGIAVEAEASLHELAKKAIQLFMPEVVGEELVEYVAKRTYERL
eukprot:863319-Lingulodinium_polyedra.AAC.1